MKEQIPDDRWQVGKSTGDRARLFDSERFKREFAITLADLRGELGFRIVRYVLIPQGGMPEQIRVVKEQFGVGDVSVCGDRGMVKAPEQEGEEREPRCSGSPQPIGATVLCLEDAERRRIEKCAPSRTPVAGMPSRARGAASWRRNRRLIPSHS